MSKSSIKEADLYALRSGELSFDTFSKKYKTVFENWVGYFYRRYTLHGLDIEDLIQEALIEAWRAVDLWDENRASLKKFVCYRVGERIDREIKRSLGWPRKGRSKPAQQIDLPIAVDNRTTNNSLNQLDRLVLLDVLSRLRTDLERDVVLGIALGASVRKVAANIYADPQRRLWYRFDSDEHAVRRVRKVVKDVTEYLES